MDDERVQEALFQLEGPDEDGCVWACSPDGRDIWCQNLGPTEKVAEVLSQWLQSSIVTRTSAALSEMATSQARTRIKVVECGPGHWDEQDHGLDIPHGIETRISGSRDRP